MRVVIKDRVEPLMDRAIMKFTVRNLYRAKIPDKFQSERR